jgi:hypothetical protein
VCGAGYVGKEVVKGALTGTCKTVQFLGKVVYYAAVPVLLPIVAAAGVIKVTLPIIKFAGGVVLLTLNGVGGVVGERRILLIITSKKILLQTQRMILLLETRFYFTTSKIFLPTKKYET